MKKKLIYIPPEAMVVELFQQRPVLAGSGYDAENNGYDNLGTDSGNAQAHGGSVGEDTGGSIGHGGWN